MATEQVYEDIWIRWAPASWEADGSWCTSIQETTLHKSALTRALFILADDRCVFVPMGELRRVLSEKPANARKTIIFRVNPKNQTIEGQGVEMHLITSGTHKKAKQSKLRKEIFSEFDEAG
jgi:hypothetical protein